MKIQTKNNHSFIESELERVEHIFDLEKRLDRAIDHEWYELAAELKQKIDQLKVRDDLTTAH